MAGSGVEGLKRIFAVSLCDPRKRFKAYAVFDGERLVIQRIEEIKGLFGTWKTPLIEEIELRKQTGFEVLVEEKTDIISPFATKFLFEDMDQEEDRINWYVALDWFYAMKGLGNVIVPAGSEQYLPKEQTAERLADEKGRIKYNLNWDLLTGGHRVVLLCVMATVLNPISDQFLADMYGTFTLGERRDPLKSFRAITVDYDKALAAKWNEGRPTTEERLDKWLEQLGYRRTGSRTTF